MYLNDVRYGSEDQTVTLTNDFNPLGYERNVDRRLKSTLLSTVEKTSQNSSHEEISLATPSKLNWRLTTEDWLQTGNEPRLVSPQLRPTAK